MSPIVKEVIIKTRVEHERSRGVGGVESQSSRPAAGLSRATREQQSADKSRIRAELDLLTAKRVYIKHEREKEQWRLGVREKSMQMEERHWAKERAKEQWLFGVKERSLALERKERELRTKQTLEQARAQDRFMSSARAQRIRDYVERETAYRRDTGQPMNIGGRESLSDRTNYFSTGIPALDRANQVGFQAFITMMTVRMIGQAMKGMGDFAMGLESGRGAGVGAQVNRMVRGRPSEEDRKSGFFGYTQRLQGTLLNTAMYLGSLGQLGRNERANAIEAMGGDAGPRGVLTPGDYARRQSLFNGGGSLAGMSLSASGRGLAAAAPEQERIKQLYQLAEASLTKQQREEDEMIRKKRDLLREEEGLYRSRLEAARAESQIARERRESAIQSVGRGTVEEFDMALDISGRIKAGQGPNQFSKTEREFMLSRPELFGEVSEAFAHNQFFAKGGQQILDNLGIDKKVFDAQKQEQMARSDLHDVVTDSIFKASLNIDTIVAEIKGLEMDLAEVLAPLIKDFMDREMQNIREQIEDGRLKRKIGNAQGTF